MRKSVYFFAVLTAVLLVFYWVYLPVISKYRDLKIQQTQMEQQIAELDTKIKALEYERELLKNDPQYLERVIRKEMGLVKPGEIIYRVIPAEQKSSSEKA